MKIAVMGSGGVGGYFGARLAQGGCDVGFVARGAHLAALREKGLVVESKLGNISLSKVRVTDDPTTLGTVDAVLIGVKLWDTEAAVRAVRDILALRADGRQDLEGAGPLFSTGTSFTPVRGHR